MNLQVANALFAFGDEMQQAIKNAERAGLSEDDVIKELRRFADQLEMDKELEA